MTADERQRLSAEWQANEAELERLGELPAGSDERARREQELNARQDAIEGQLGAAWLAARRPRPVDPRLN